MKRPRTAQTPIAPIEELDVLSIAGASPDTAQEIRDVLARVGAEIAAAESFVDELEAFEEANVLDASDEELDANAAKIVRAKRRQTRLERVRERLSGLLEAAEAREAEATRVESYQAAQKAIAEVETWIRQDYARHAGAIADGLAQITDVDTLVDMANADLPEGASALEVEGFRALPGTASTTTYKTERYYADAEGRERRPTDDEPLSQDAGGQYFIGSSGRYPVFARTREVPERTPGRPRAVPRDLSAAVHLPGIEYADTDFWPRRSKAWGGT